MADLPLVIVLAVGAAAAGGPEALGLLLAHAGRSAAADVAICAFLICAITAPVLGTMLLARYLRVVGTAPHPPAPATERFARLTLAVALAVVLFVTACLLAAPTIPAGRGGSEATGAARSCYA